MHQFFLILCGGGRARIDGRDYVLAAGTAMLIPPLVIHEFWFDSGTNGFVASVAALTLNRLLDAEPLAGSALASPMVLRCGAGDPEIMDLQTVMQAALAEFGRNGTARDAALSAWAGLIAIWFSRTSGREAAMIELRKDARASLVHRFIARVESDFRTHRKLPAYAGALGVSVPHLTRSCRELLGYPATSIIHDRLMLEARRHLVYTSMTISQVAFLLGFSDAAYFSRFFAARAGMAPSDYRVKNPSEPRLATAPRAASAI